MSHPLKDSLLFFTRKALQEHQMMLSSYILHKDHLADFNYYLKMMSQMKIVDDIYLNVSLSFFSECLHCGGMYNCLWLKCNMKPLLIKFIHVSISFSGSQSLSLHVKPTAKIVLAFFCLIPRGKRECSKKIALSFSVKFFGIKENVVRKLH